MWGLHPWENLVTPTLFSGPAVSVTWSTVIVMGTGTLSVVTNCKSLGQTERLLTLLPH